MGLWNDTPGLDFAHRLLANYTEFKKEITVAAVNVATGEYTTFNTSDTSFYDMQQATLCSASIPGVFPPQHFKGEYYMDGGTVWNINIVSAIEQCLNNGYAEEDVVLDMYICGFSNLTVEANGTNNGL
jgi:predicted acylesterase/phospholipase RssA